MRFEETKTNDQRTGYVAAEILALIPEREPDDCLFHGKRKWRVPLLRHTVRGAMNRVFDRAGVPRGEVDVHRLRRTWITAGLWTPSVSLAESMKHTGHHSPAVHLYYQRNAEDSLRRSADRVRRSRSRVLSFSSQKEPEIRAGEGS